MRTYSKYRVIRKYTIDIFDCVRKKKFKKPDLCTEELKELIELNSLIQNNQDHQKF